MVDSNEVEHKIRARLKDDNHPNTRFSLPEILDAINAIVANLILEFKLNRTQKAKLLEPSSPRLQTPYLLGILQAKFEGRTLYKRVSVDNATELSLLIQEDALSVSPFRAGTLSVIYYAYEPITTLDQSLPLPSIACDAVVYGALSLLLEVPTDESNYQKIGVFKNLFKEAKSLLALYLNSLYNCAGNSFSRVVRV
ncbi:hypothetical protein [Helicobacter salomonis]|uniref:hypothetical protein n=1 Tax=Helicobacter salomonis TaxID=56878 RepID=UPI000CF11CDB|nr:hypothetical protein [Helicobacter salomonis]